MLKAMLLLHLFVQLLTSGLGLNRLTEAMCKNVSATNKTTMYNEFIRQPTYRFLNEGELAMIACRVKNSTKCKGFSSAALEGVRIVNCDTEEEVEYANRTKNSPDGILFTIILNHTKHSYEPLRCDARYEGVTLISSEMQFEEIVKFVEVSLTPIVQTVTLGSTFNLTCAVTKGNTIKYIEWFRQNANSNGIKQPFECSEHRECTQYESADHLRAILSIRTYTNETTLQWKYFCTGNRDHPVNSYVDAEVNFKKPEVWPYITMGVVTGAVLITVLTVFIINNQRQRRVQENVRLAQTRMQFGIMLEETKAGNQYGRSFTGMYTDNLDYDVDEIINRITENHSSRACSREHISLKKVIGEGNFGEVMLGTMPTDLNILQHVAIKTIKQQSADIKTIIEFEKEIDVMASLRHKNIVNLLGICIDEWPFFIIMEYMENGPLNHFLYLHAPVNNPSLTDGHGPFTLEQLIYMCYQPCSALEYLASKNMVHRDVSARNCLVGQDLVVKLADFGLSRDTSDNAKHYYKKEGGMVPVKWMAPEALTYGKYTTANDVWAFGVLMWEIFSYGANPYSAFSNQQVMVYVSQGGRLECPKNCPREIFTDVMSKCWIDLPDQRIMFGAALAFLSHYLVLSQS